MEVFRDLMETTIRKRRSGMFRMRRVLPGAPYQVEERRRESISEQRGSLNLGTQVSVGQPNRINLKSS